MHKWLESDSIKTLELEPTNVESGMFKYEIDIQTSDSLRSGTDANITLTLYGDEETVSFRLDKSNTFTQNRDLFETGSLDRFIVYIKEDIGEIQKIGIKSDGKGLDSSWKVETIKIKVDKLLYL
jgi:hypothetical protein